MLTPTAFPGQALKIRSTSTVAVTVPQSLEAEALQTSRNKSGRKQDPCTLDCNASISELYQDVNNCWAAQNDSLKHSALIPAHALLKLFHQDKIQTWTGSGLVIQAATHKSIFYLAGSRSQAGIIASSTLCYAAPLLPKQ